MGGSPKPDLRPYPGTPNLRGRFGGSPKPYPYPDRDGDRIPEPVASPDAIPDPVPGSDLDSDPTLSEPVELCAHPVSSAFGIATKDSRPLSTHRTRARFLTAVWRTATQQQHTIGTDSMPDRVADRDAILIVHAAAKHSTLDVFTTKLLTHQTVRLLTCSSPHLLFL